jgi:hypothetical protein
VLPTFIFSAPVSRVAGKALGRIFLLTHFVRAKRVRRRQGAQPLGLLVDFLKEILVSRLIHARL